LISGYEEDIFRQEKISRKNNGNLTINNREFVTGEREMKKIHKLICQSYLAQGLRDRR